MTGAVGLIRESAWLHSFSTGVGNAWTEIIMRKIGDAGSHRPQPDWAAVHRELRRPGDASAVVGGASRIAQDDAEAAMGEGSPTSYVPSCPGTRPSWMTLRPTRSLT
jgi:hypothetical protein